MLITHRVNNQCANDRWFDGQIPNTPNIIGTSVQMFSLAAGKIQDLRIIADNWVKTVRVFAEIHSELGR